MSHEARILAGARAIESLAPAVCGWESVESARALADEAAVRGWFRPDDEEHVLGRFAVYLTARAGLLETIDELKPVAMGEAKASHADRLRAFVIGYTAAALLVGAARAIVRELASHKVVQRKLNEGSESLRIPPGVYDAVFRNLTSSRNAWRLQRAMWFADDNRPEIESLTDDPVMAPTVQYLQIVEDQLRVGVRQYAKGKLRNWRHRLKQRGRRAERRAFFAMTEAFGRAIAEVRNPFHSKRLTGEIIDELSIVLSPGDVLITRHHNAATNLFLPGYWPHASLYIGPPESRDALSIDLEPERANRWDATVRTLEAQKDGVRFRALHHTLAVDAVAVIRPTIYREAIGRAISRAATHEGKLYNFDFDFFSTDRLVCTEVIYRAYDGVGGLTFELTNRFGRQTFSAEDLLDMALERRGFEVVAVFGAPGCENAIVHGAEAREVLRRTYRADQSETGGDTIDQR